MAGVPNEQKLKDILSEIKSILDEAEFHNEYGGGETDNGVLHPGVVDFDHVYADIRAILVTKLSNKPER